MSSLQVDLYTYYSQAFITMAALALALMGATAWFQFLVYRKLAKPRPLTMKQLEPIAIFAIGVGLGIIIMAVK